MKKQLLLLFALSTLLFSCEKEDKAIVLPPPGSLQTMVANMGSAYDNQIFVNLETGEQTIRNYKLYDLAFEASPVGFRIYLNTAKFMFVTNTLSTDISSADTTGHEWKTETDNLYDDSTSFGDWRDASQASLNQVYVIDRGRTEHFGTARWRKFQVISVDANSYHIRYSLYNNTQLTDFTIPKDPAYSLMYFSFENGGQMAQVAPEKSKWDMVFTKFTHTYYTEPINSPYRYYMVTGALLNRWSDDENTIMKKDSTPGYKSFEEIKGTDMVNFPFYKEAAIIGFEWKEYDFNLGYIIYTDRYYVLKNQSEFYYKIRFLDFYDSQGNKGAASFEYQRL